MFSLLKSVMVGRHMSQIRRSPHAESLRVRLSIESLEDRVVLSTAAVGVALPEMKMALVGSMSPKQEIVSAKLVKHAEIGEGKHDGVSQLKGEIKTAGVGEHKVSKGATKTEGLSQHKAVKDSTLAGQETSTGDMPVHANAKIGSPEVTMQTDAKAGIHQPNPERPVHGYKWRPRPWTKGLQHFAMEQTLAHEIRTADVVQPVALKDVFLESHAIRLPGGSNDPRVKDPQTEAMIASLAMTKIAKADASLGTDGETKTAAFMHQTAKGEVKTEGASKHKVVKHATETTVAAKTAKVEAARASHGHGPKK
jgi:hypothetical protein